MEKRGGRWREARVLVLVMVLPEKIPLSSLPAELVCSIVDPTKWQKISSHVHPVPQVEILYCTEVFVPTLLCPPLQKNK